VNQPADYPELKIITDFLQGVLPFSDLVHEDLFAIARQLEIIYFKRGQLLQYSGGEKQGLRILRSGAVEIVNHEGQLLDRLGEGESFNLAGLCEEQEGVKARFIEDSLIYRLPDECYQRWRDQHRNIDRFFHKQRSRRIRRAVRVEPDSNMMMRPLSELMSKNVLTVELSASLQNAAKIMTKGRVSSLMVLDEGDLVGIVTDRDMRSRAIADDLPSSTPVSQVMTTEPYVINQTETLFDATLTMLQLGFHHLPVVNDEGALTGIVTASDLMLARQDDPVFLVQHISRQIDEEGMKNVVSSLPEIMQGWVKSGVRAHQISHMLTAISDAITQRLIALAIKKLGEPPVSFAWLSFGSQARDEQLLGADQDNGLLIADTLKNEDKPWFKELAAFVCDGLNHCGYDYCLGKVMATTDEWRQPLSQWIRTVDTWTRSPTPDAVMRVSIFFDLRVVYGDRSLGEQLQQYMLERTQRDTIFLAALAANVLEYSSPLGIFRRFVVERSGEHQDTLDLKKRGIIPIVDMIRLHALAHGVSAVNTRARLKELQKRGVLNIGDSRNVQDAFDFIMQLRVNNHVVQLSQGGPCSNYANPNDLPELSRRHLRDAFTIIHDSQQAIKLRYRSGLG